jgi:hypothetical protein
MPITRQSIRHLTRVAALGCALGGAGTSWAAAPAACSVQSGPNLTPVLELYTSEGCSSCPPADKWLSGLKPAAAEGKVVVQAFHVGYWDDIGWVDRFASPAHTARQREIAAANGLRNIYTPQLVRNGRDWRDYDGALSVKPEPAKAIIKLERTGPDALEALVTPLVSGEKWSAYWTVTENGHSSKVKSGENAGEFLQHDFVVRQYVPVGAYEGEQRLRVRVVAAERGRGRTVNLVVGSKGRVWQASAMHMDTGATGKCSS